MIEIKKLKSLRRDELEGLFNRFGDDYSSVMIDTVIPIVDDVRENGDDAVKRYTEKFDGVKLKSILASEGEIERGYKNIPGDIINAFMEARRNIEEFHLHQKKKDIIYSRDDGTTLGVMYQPIERSAIYVPGGKASYPSSVLMGVIPAKIAGAEEITLITPPDSYGNIPDIILAMCKILDVKRVIKSGGAQGISAAAFGTESVERSDIIVGPGNIYVTAAKTYLFSLGIIQIDSMAGPSEILIIADENSNPLWVAYDLLSQAEHDEMAYSILLTTSQGLAKRVREEIIDDIESRRGRYTIKKESISRNGYIFLVESIDEAIDFSSRFAPEHMELMISNPLEYLKRIKNVGSLFLGSHAPVAVGDYFSGTNHILPTGGAARFSSGLSVETFLRRTTFQHLTESALKRACEPITIMSRVEGFDDKHGGSVNIRFNCSD
jgi:histidinol dehydrogenase